MNKKLLDITEKESIVFCSPVRNCGKFIDNVMNNVFRIGGLFKNFNVVLVESDSTDNTKELLKKYADLYPNIFVLSLGNLEPKIPVRTQRIALARNIAIEFAESKGFLDSGYYCAMCFDDVNSQDIDLNGFLSCFKYNDWAGMTAFQPNLYYDTWCLRHSTICNYDCWYEVYNRPSTMTREEAVEYFVIRPQHEIIKYKELIEVDAAHGGLSLFKSEYAKGCRYEGIDKKTNFELCDLVPFCYQVKEKGGRIFINPEMINIKE